MVIISTFENAATVNRNDYLPNMVSLNIVAQVVNVIMDLLVKLKDNL